jgi:capsular exopolysaccharide synthesis family protein
VSTEVAALKANLQKATRATGETLENNYRIALDQETKLGREVERARHDVVSAEGLRARFEALEREAVANRTLHESVASRLRETSLAASVPGPVLRWEDMPMVPDKPVKPHKSVLLLLASFAGLFFGLVFAMGLELADGRVRDSAAAARATGVPLLASVAVMSDGRGGDFALLSQPDSETSEAFRRLRAALSPPAGHNGPATVLFASAKSGEGRSFCAMNYAASLAMQGLRTILVDADMRSPGLSLQHMQSPDSQIGLGDFLAGNAEPAKACHPTMLPNLYLLSSGAMRPNAAELLSGTRFPALLEDAYRWFDCVVIDSPPLLATSDALAITRYADRTCLVVRELAADRRELKRASDLVRTSGGNLVGFVWNKTPQKSRSGLDAGPSLPVFRPLLAGSVTDEVVPGPRVQMSGPSGVEA